MKKKNKIALSALGILAVLGIGVYTYYLAYGRNFMTLDILQAKEYLWRSRASIDLDEMADYMTRARTAINDRTGNPNWLYHLPDTDFDLIKHDLEVNIETANNISETETPGSYGYQRAVTNLEEVSIELNDHLNLAIQWSTDLTPTTIGLNLIAWTIFIAIIIYLIAANRTRFTFQRTTWTVTRKTAP